MRIPTLKAELEVVVGWTKPNRSADYQPMSDGYRTGAEQHTEAFKVLWTNQPAAADEAMLATLGVTAEEAEAHRRLRVAETIAEACFYATNAPRLTLPEGLTGQVCEALDATGYRGEQAGHYSLSMGDTVTVEGVKLACSRVGWTPVS